MSKFFSAFLFLLLSCGILQSALAQSRDAGIAHDLDPRGTPELVVCSQNLANFGSYVDMRKRVKNLTPTLYAEKAAALIKRFLVLHCDVIAVQEALGSNRDRAADSLRLLADEMRVRTGRVFDVFTGDSNDKYFRNAFFVARDRAEMMNAVSYASLDLPRLSEKQRPRKFVRGPFEIELRVKAKGESEERTVFLVDFHFKSKRSIPADPAELEWETYRMEMAEGLRQVLSQRHKSIFEEGQNILLTLGDRNSNYDSASARILEGKLTLGHFQKDAVCRLSKRGVPLCQPGKARAASLFSVLTSAEGLQSFPGTFRYNDTYSWLDEILMPEINLTFARKKYDVEGEYDSGVLYEPPQASDHGMAWVRLNW